MVVVVENREDEAVAEELERRWGVTELYPDRLYTLSEDPSLAVRDVLPSADPLHYLFKPSGLWYGVGSSWIQFCVCNGLHSRFYPYLYDLEVDRTNVLCLNTVEETFAFTAKYGEHELGWDFVRVINWARVWEDYHGMEINPYIGSLHVEPRVFWYNRWDCASGCVWKSEAVTSVKLISGSQKK